MPARQCLTCGVLSNATRCPTCARGERRRIEMNPNRQARKALLYNASYRMARRAWEAAFAMGHEIRCARCGEPIREPWDLGHQPDGNLLPEHSECNRSAGGKKSG